jgi:hypothetical protein
MLHQESEHLGKLVSIINKANEVAKSAYVQGGSGNTGVSFKEWTKDLMAVLGNVNSFIKYVSHDTSELIKFYAKLDQAMLDTKTGQDATANVENNTKQ